MLTEQLRMLAYIACLIVSIQLLVHLRMKLRVSHEIKSKLEHVLDRIDSWWVILILIALALYFSKTGICVLFALISFYALREFVTLASESSSDHRALFWMFFFVLPIQYLSIYKGWTITFNYLVPVFSLVFLPFRASLTGDVKNFLQRTSSLQWGLMTSVFCVSHLPAILLLNIPGYTRNAELLLYFMIITQINDSIQHEVGLWFGKFKIVPTISNLRTWEGWFLGTIGTTILGGVLSFMTPFNFNQAMLLSFVCTQLGFAGCLVMSAIKRSRGIQIFDELIPGHGGVLDRIDTIIFSAPAFFHMVRLLFKN